MKTYAYLRVSGAGQVEGDGFPRQEAAIRGYADAHDIEVVQVFREEGVSGTTGEADRPAFQGMVAAILANGVKAIIVEGLDRLAREYRVQETLLVYLASKGISLINARTGEDVTLAVTEDPMKKALVQIQGIFAELEKNMLTKKLRAARERKRQVEGKCEGRKGYSDTEGGRAILAQLKKLHRKNPKTGKRRSFAEIATAMNDAGVKTMTGRDWTKLTVQSALRNASMK